MATEIAKAYVQIIPTTKGIKNQLETELSGGAASAGEKAGSGFASSLGSAITKSAAAIGASAAAAVAAIGKSAVAGFADYEQLVGGVETLFSSLDGSASSAADVLANAANAYKTAGLSTNEYMETVTSFSAALVSSLEGDYAKAASVSDMAITDMADNANKMGSSMESIQNAYQGFAKQNYTMLDNLKLGYGGTKSEMERLLADAEAFSGVHYDISNLNDVYEAIHVIQGEMGITGTTAKEASSTISGSLASMKAAWENVLVGIADENADFGSLIQDLVTAIVGEGGEGGVINNILPRLEAAMVGIGDLISELAPIVMETITDLIDTVLPTVVDSAISMVEAFGNGILDNFDLLVQDALDLVLFLADKLIENADLIIDGAVKIVESLAMWIEEYSDVLIQKAIYLVEVLTSGLIDNLPTLIRAAIEIIGALATGLIENLPDLLKEVPGMVLDIASAFIECIPDIFDVGVQIVKGLWDGITSMGDWLGGKIGGFFDGVVDGAKDILGIHSPSKVFSEIGGYMAEGIGVGFSEEMRSVAGDINSSIPVSIGAISGINRGIGNRAFDNVSVAADSQNSAIYELNATFEMDGQTIARKQYRFNQAEAARRGVSLVNA